VEAVVHKLEGFMSYEVKRLIPVSGLVLVFAYAAINIVISQADEIKLPLPPALNNLAAVNQIEIKDAGGQVVLSGNFTTSSDQGGEIEREAALTGAGVDADATGKAEIEISKESDAFTELELEVEVEHLAPQSVFKVFVDNQEVASFTTDARGEAELEMSNEASK
jgi:hypothetical protein